MAVGGRPLRAAARSTPQRALVLRSTDSVENDRGSTSAVGKISLVPDYYVNTVAQSNGDHEVHTSTCTYLPSLANRLFLGNYPSCSRAVAEAKRFYRQSNGCFTCSRPCHTS